MDYTDRIVKITNILKVKSLNAFFITNPYNILYLTGFIGVSPTEREATLLISKNSTILYSSAIYDEQIKLLQVKNNFKQRTVHRGDELFTQPFTDNKSFLNIGLEEKDLKLSEYKLLKSFKHFKFKLTDNLVEELRIIKDGTEIDMVKQAVKITDNIFTQIINGFSPDITEKSLAKNIIKASEKYKIMDLAFTPIVASGKNSSNPHYSTSFNKIAKGILLIDSGINYKSYNSDMTRTYFIGKPDNKFVKTYELVMKTLEKVIETIKPGLSAENLWQLATDLLGSETKYFIHNFFHGICF